MDLDLMKDHGLVSSFRRDARIIFLELDELLFTVRMNAEDEDKEQLIHDIRVNFRRLISLLLFHEPLLRKKKYRELIADLNLMLRSFASERTDHVFHRSMEKYLSSSGKDQILEDMVLRGLLLKKQPDKHHVDPMQFRVTYEGTLKSLLGYGRDIFRTGAMNQKEDTQAFYSKRYQELMAGLKKLEENMDYDDKKSIHRLRVAAKNIYYTLKAKEEILGELASRRAAYLKEIHSIGGKIHDADVNLRILSTFTVEDHERTVLDGFADYLREERSQKIGALKDWIQNE